MHFLGRGAPTAALLGAIPAPSPVPANQTHFRDYRTVPAVWGPIQASLTNPNSVPGHQAQPLEPSLRVPGHPAQPRSISWSTPVGSPRTQPWGSTNPTAEKCQSLTWDRGKLCVHCFLPHPDRLLLPPSSGTQGFTTKQHLLQHRFTQPKPYLHFNSATARAHTQITLLSPDIPASKAAQVSPWH